MICPYCNKPVHGKIYLMVNGERVYLHKQCKNEAAREWILERGKKDATSIQQCGSKGGT